jgi:hypothetical protein
MYVKQFTLPYCLWQYNNIMGYIKISASKSDIFFDIYKSSCQKYSYKSKRKKFIQNIYANGLHFYVSNMSNNEITAMILEYLQDIQKNHFSKNRFIDYSIFNNIINFIDIVGIMNSIQD